MDHMFIPIPTLWPESCYLIMLQVQLSVIFCYSNLYKVFPSVFLVDTLGNINMFQKRKERQPGKVDTSANLTGWI